MNVIKHTKYIWELENFIPTEEIDYFLDMFAFYNPVLQTEFRSEERNNDTYEATDHPDLDNLAWKWINTANKYYVSNNDFIYYQWNKEPFFLSDPKTGVAWRGKNIIRMYNDDDSYNWHSDHSQSDHAEFSYIIYLNDDFDGGETRFMNDKLTVLPKKGTVLCFPVDHYHIHKGMKVTGHKKILWNCVYRHEIQVVGNQPYLTATNAPRTSKRCIW